MIVVDQEKCKGDGLCARICHEGCITVTGGSVSIDQRLCSTCTQCVAICPHGALTWDGVPPLAFAASHLPTAEQMDELFKERRTIRHFKEDRIDRALLQEIIEYGIYAPTNNYDLRAIAVDDEAVIAELDQVCVRFTAQAYHIFYEPKLVFNLLRKLTPALDPRDKVKMEGVIARGYTLRRPPALVFIAGDRMIAHSEASAQYALYNMMLYAQVKGIGSCLWGGGKLALDRSQTARQRLDLSRGEHILGILALGYPAIRFHNKVLGKKLPIRWI